MLPRARMYGASIDATLVSLFDQVPICDSCSRLGTYSSTRFGACSCSVILASFVSHSPV
ncbi:hypothetical protein [Nannocystis radixulma]|uniref:Uncharacterized protein n=1 Tax=Nannocystis radixulma TaxID=2995305 RepID=A0ABT5BKX6_9BACT|nr:hypothetical protein [Nannocystis radixulma]MDC0674807.1 hypothetical protein [Nannocystis radixulma]